MKPNFIVAGAQKSGSTFLQLCLAEHPEIFLVPGEVPFFEDPDYLNGNISDFENLFLNVQSQKIIGIKRPSYFSRPEVPERIYKHYPKIKLIVIFRNPIERAVSAYFHKVRNGFLPAIDVEQGMLKILNGEYDKTFKTARDVVDFGFYYKHLSNFLKYFTLDQIHITFFDDLTKKPVNSLRKIYRFLNVDDSYTPMNLNQRPQSVIYSIPRLKVLTLTNSFLYNYNLEKTRLYIKNQSYFDQLFVDSINKLDAFLLKKIFLNDKPRLSSHLRNILSDIYSEDVYRLSKLTGQNLNHWVEP
jgi:hypothetical protein